MTSHLNRKLIKRYQLSVGVVYIYENYAISEINEGIALSYENAKELLELGKAHYGKHTPFVFISNRKNSYSFNPTSHFKTIPVFPNLKGFAVVVYDSMNKEIAEMEQSFVNKPVNIFDNLDEAIIWVEKLIVSD
ncbi:hypothetical protein I2486_08805 [Cellulophaga sp. E16_2]|uniref:STAS/SEC14 domain-containing protein n=1 Tax=Cellulophaga algicola (strain DSM 14237 / IC166 / ACAM 630) TaxID=688270 RepID=E6XCR5_CELAD|nr:MULTISPECIES: hypothetical protein [Cellulophaga]ADV49054.1 hypothetical protein Celal_1753 [Cellulophaga algicola DSM 14237]MBO0591507.1 hypothetical protein [Cellulophaga sp. E16_2]